MRGFIYKDWLIEDLRTLERNRGAIEQMTSELQTIEAELTAIKATSYDKMPTASGVNFAEERMLTAIAKKDEIEANLRATALHVEDMDRLLRTLTEQEYEVLEKMYIRRENRAAEKLANAMGYEVAQVYRIKNQALIHLAQCRYGKGFQM